MRKLYIAGFFFIAAAHAWPPGLTDSDSAQAGKPPPLRVLSFGDSIASGFNRANLFSVITGGTYADQLGQQLSKATGHAVAVSNAARAGLSTQQIFNQIVSRHAREINAADLVLLEGGGNDLLAIQKSKTADLCIQRSYMPALVSIRDNLMRAADFIKANRKPGSALVVLGIYYPLLNYTKAQHCAASDGDASRDGTSVDLIAILNWGFQKGAQARGFRYVDLFAKLNCGPRYQAECRVANYSSLPRYRARLRELDRIGAIRDLKDAGLVQPDGLHPNRAGNALITAALASALRAEPSE